MRRLADIFLQQREHRLADYGFLADAGQFERCDDSSIVFYHYTHRHALEAIFAPGSGLRARLPVVHMDVVPELRGRFLVEGLLEPLPQWLRQSPYFGDLGLEMMRQYVGNVLLQITVPAAFPGLYIADAAHNFECKHLSRRGVAALNLGYDCRTGHESCTTEALSYLPLTDYQGGFLAPTIKATCEGAGMVIAREYLTVCETQPLAS